jgi:hypothetical protein
VCAQVWGAAEANGEKATYPLASVTLWPMILAASGMCHWYPWLVQSLAVSAGWDIGTEALKSDTVRIYDVIRL